MFLQNKMFSRCNVFQAKQHIISYVKHCPLPYYIAPSDPSNATINLLFLHFTQLLHSLNPFYLSDELNKLLIKSRILTFYTVQNLAIPLKSYQSKSKKDFQHSYDMTFEGKERMFCGFLCLFW